jgi:uncharacterized membrane protein
MQPVVDTLKAWQLHPFVDHFSVAIIVIGVLLDLGASVFATRMWIRYAALCLMIIGAAAVAGSNVTGGWEAGRVWEHVNGPAKPILERHAEFGDILPWVFAALALWRIGVQFLGFISTTRPIYLLVAVLAMGAILYQGRLGGELVYVYGIGTEIGPGGAAPSEVKPGASTAEQPASPAVPTPIPTVYVPTATATPAAAPSPEPSGTQAASPGTSPSTSAAEPTPVPSSSSGPPPSVEATPSAPASPEAAEPSASPSPASSAPKNL